MALVFVKRAQFVDLPRCAFTPTLDRGQPPKLSPPPANR